VSAGELSKAEAIRIIDALDRPEEEM
jgi:hypothetical protein